METHPNPDTVALNVTGMHCNNCALSVHKALEKRGLRNIFVSFADDEVKFAADGSVPIADVVKDIQQLGFKVSQTGDTPTEKWHEKVENRFLFSLVFAIPLFLHMFVPWHVLHNPYVQLALCVPVFALGCVHFGKSAFYSLKSGVPNMDVLIFTGSTAAFIYSLIGTVQQLGPDYMFYETTAVIITLVLLGNVFEKRSVTQTTSAIKDLVKHQQTKAVRIVGGQQETIDSRDIVAGDTLLVSTGDKIPADGDIIWGEGAANESMVTGESVPVEKSKYDSVIGGTVLERGTIKITATKVGSKSTLAQIISLMKEAQAAKPPIQRLGDRVASIFVPVVVGIAVLTFVLGHYSFDLPFQRALMNAIAVLVVSCPCAMGLATPTAVMVGLGRAARQGILIKGGDTVEEMAGLKYMVFDKTGTLTTGNFAIRSLQAQGITQAQAATLIVGIERYSNHPVARSLASALDEMARESTDRPIFAQVAEEKGIGMKAVDPDGRTYRVGSKTTLAEAPPTWAADADIFLSRDGELLAAVSITDELKPGARELIDSLRQRGITPVLLSGDRKAKCLALAGEIGIDIVHYEKMPHEKLAVINQLKTQGTTAMVGDGINDAPALTTADVGISLGDASQVAIQSAKVVLLNSDLGSIDRLIRVGKHTLLTIKQNLFWALFYNVFAIPLAAFGFLGPMLAALAMACSDVVVIGNSLRLKIKRLR